MLVVVFKRSPLPPLSTRPAKPAGVSGKDTEMGQYVGHERGVLAVARSGGQGKDSVHHPVWLVSFSSHAIWPVQRSCDIPAYHEPRAVGTYLGEHDRLLRRCERHWQDLPRKSGQPESGAVPVPEVWTEAEASEVRALQA